MDIYHESKLKNGLSVITAKHPNSDVITMSLWIKAGSRYELPHERGYAHILEHLLIKGTQKTPLQEFGKKIDRLGAYMNAFTSAESMSFRVQVSKDRYKELLVLLAEAITCPLFNEEILKNEKKVILEEWNRFHDNRASRIGAQSISSVFEKHPISNNPIGEKDIIEQATIKSIKSYHDTYIVPDRATLIISGDIIHDEVVRIAEECFLRDWVQRSGDQRDELVTDFKVKKGSSFIQDSANQTNLFFNYICPHMTVREAVVLDMIANTLGYGKFPLLKQKLRYDSGLIYSINVQTSKFQDVGLFYVATSSTQPQEVIRMVKDVLYDFDTFYTQETLEEFKEQFKNVLLRKLADPFFEIEQLWIYKKLRGELVSLKEIMKEIESLNVDTILAVRKKYLSEDNLYITAFGDKNPFV